MNLEVGLNITRQKTENVVLEIAIRKRMGIKLSKLDFGNNKRGWLSS